VGTRGSEQGERFREREYVLTDLFRRGLDGEV